METPLSCAQGENPALLGQGGRGIFCWNKHSKLVLSVHTKFHLSELPGSALKVLGGWWVVVVV